MIKIGVLGTSGIAERRMIPAIRKEPSFAYAGVAASTKEEMGFPGTDADFLPLLEKKREKAARIQQTFGGKIYESYTSLLADPDIGAVYIALPPALHFRWIKTALQRGKHVLAEKPFTTRETDAAELATLARQRNLAMIENYGFCYHGQMELIKNLIAGGAVGELRLVRATFGFPHRDASDFRYNRDLGGGALLDCGGYTLKAASAILGPETEVLSAVSIQPDGYEVDLFGNVMARNPKGICAQLSYGMDHAYRCELEIWGSKGLITAPRIFTAPDGFPAPVRLKTAQGIEEQTVSDDQFQRIVSHFETCIHVEHVREQVLDEILQQSRLTERVRQLARTTE